LVDGIFTDLIFSEQTESMNIITTETTQTVRYFQANYSRCNDKKPSCRQYSRTASQQTR